MSWDAHLAPWPQMEHYGVGSHPCHFFQMADIVEVSRASTLELQNQLDEYKEKNRRELAEMQRQLKEKTLEAEKSRLTAVKMQDEVMPGRSSSRFTRVQNILQDCFESLLGEAWGRSLRQRVCLLLGMVTLGQMAFQDTEDPGPLRLSGHSFSWTIFVINPRSA